MRVDLICRRPRLSAFVEPRNTWFESALLPASNRVLLRFALAAYRLLLYSGDLIYGLLDQDDGYEKPRSIKGQKVYPEV